MHSLEWLREFQEAALWLQNGKISRSLGRLVLSALPTICYFLSEMQNREGAWGSKRIINEVEVKGQPKRVKEWLYTEKKKKKALYKANKEQLPNQPNKNRQGSVYLQKGTDESVLSNRVVSVHWYTIKTKATRSLEGNWFSTSWRVVHRSVGAWVYDVMILESTFYFHVMCSF